MGLESRGRREDALYQEKGGFYGPLGGSYNEGVFPSVVIKIRLGKQESDHKGLKFYAK